MDKVVDKHCEGCVHLTHFSETMACCSCLFHTGKKRPCDPGESCTVKQTKRKRRKGGTSNAETEPPAPKE